MRREERAVLWRAGSYSTAAAASAPRWQVLSTASGPRLRVLVVGLLVMAMLVVVELGHAGTSNSGLHDEPFSTPLTAQRT